MGLTDETKSALKGAGGIVPKYISVDGWKTLTGMGRSKTYELLADGTLRAVKVGRSLRIDVEYGLSALAAMPRADVRVASRPRKNAA